MLNDTVFFLSFFFSSVSSISKQRTDRQINIRMRWENREKKEHNSNNIEIIKKQTKQRKKRKFDAKNKEIGRLRPSSTWNWIRSSVELTIVRSSLFRHRISINTNNIFFFSSYCFDYYFLTFCFLFQLLSAYSKCFVRWYISFLSVEYISFQEWIFFFAKAECCSDQTTFKLHEQRVSEACGDRVRQTNSRRCRRNCDKRGVEKKSWSGTGSCVHMLWTMSVYFFDRSSFRTWILLFFFFVYSHCSCVQKDLLNL